MSYELLVNSSIWLPKIFFGVVFLAAVLIFSLRKTSGLAKTRLLIVVVISFRVFYAVLLTIGQYYVWSRNEFTELLLNSPGYFKFYSYSRFWLNVLISIGAAFVFYLFLKFLEKHQGRFFEEGETELGFLTALIVDWPDFVVFMPIVFVSVAIISIFRRVFLKEVYTTLGWPFLSAALITLIFGSELIAILDLGILRI